MEDGMCIDEAGQKYTRHRPVFPGRTSSLATSNCKGGWETYLICSQE